MADRGPVSVTKVMAGLGGALLIASFFLPLLHTGADVGQELFGIQNLRAEIESVREVEATRPFIEPALHQLELFSVTPSLRNLSGLAAASREVIDAAVSFRVAEADKLRKVSVILGIVRACLWLLPLVGLVQVVTPLVSLLRGHAGFVGLVARFGFGLLFALVAYIPLAGMPASERALIGSAAYVLLVGSLLMMAASLLGVTRRSWLPVLAADLLLLIAVGAALIKLAAALEA